MPLHWGIILGKQLLFATESADIARRFMMLPGFRVYDHTTGCYVGLEASPAEAYDLIPEHELRKRT